MPFVTVSTKFSCCNVVSESSFADNYTKMSPDSSVNSPLGKKQ